MRWKPFVWFAVSLLCFAGAVWFWQWGERRAQQRGEQASPTAAQQSGSTGATPSASTVQPSVPATNTPAATRASYTDPVFPNRLRNTPAPLDELIRSDTAVLLENALVDTALGIDVAVPDRLRSQGDPAAYIVQARGVITDAFRRMIASAGGTVVSYIPNNAYLVRASGAASGRMAGDALTQSVLPFEPYYKLKGELLRLALEDKPLPEGTVLNVVLFSDLADETREALQQLGGAILAEEASPFGPALKLRVPEGELPSVAALDGIQIVDRAYARVLANDLARARVGVAQDSVTPDNFLDLTGSNILVQVVDSGVDGKQGSGHGDFSVGRVSADPILDPAGLSLIDKDGHGTHVAGTLAGNGDRSIDVTATNIGGSTVPVTEGQFRGMAPKAEVLSIGSISGELFSVSDRSLQESAGRNGAQISNNSWRQLGNTAYDITAASYDAAVRDALPGTTGSQPVLYVFAAGNEGFGNTSGTGGFEGGISSPATAKNVITVGAIEQLRNLTNEVVTCENNDTNNCVTNTPFALRTDSDDEVAYFSSRGNVGIFTEGEFGRFKPDVVAPGEFVISTRSGDWNTNAYYNPTNAAATTLPEQVIDPGSVIDWLLFVPNNAVGLDIYVSPPSGLPVVLPDMPIYLRQFEPVTPADVVGTNNVSLPPPPLSSGFWFYGVGNPTDDPINFDITYVLYTTNPPSPETKLLRELNETLAPSYRYESGTSMAAPVVSGTLALMHEYFVRTFDITPSPALLKALMINSSRTVNPFYHYEVYATLNEQGWGLINLTNALTTVTNEFDTPSRVFFADQDAEAALATGESRTLKLSGMSTNQSLRFTLVWTDPPGNPAAGTKLVNDLDLVVSNDASGEVFYGNDIDGGTDWTRPQDTNTAVRADSVNNVENIFIQAPVGSNYTVFVKARRVNVNAVTDHPDDVVQDYALVIGSGDADGAGGLTVDDQGPNSAQVLDPTGFTNFVTLGTQANNDRAVTTSLERQRVGSNTPLLPELSPVLVSTNGMTNQWHFYVITNTTTFTNAAFITYRATELSVPRMGVSALDPDENATRRQADIDLYVSRNPGLLVLNSAAVASADKSLSRGGNETVVLTDSAAGVVYYIGVKSEDREASEFSLRVIFSESPLGGDDFGSPFFLSSLLPELIGSGSAGKPSGAVIDLSLFGGTTERRIRRVVLTNTISHDNFGDLISVLDDLGPPGPTGLPGYAVLHNHRDLPPPTQTFIYEDNDEGDVPGSQPSDGPGSLLNFFNKEPSSAWELRVVDDALVSTGSVDFVNGFVEWAPTTNVLVQGTVLPGRFKHYPFTVPPGATNFSICFTNVSVDARVLVVYVKRVSPCGSTGALLPSTNRFDYLFTSVGSDGDCFSIDIFDVPPLVPGDYVVSVFNPGPVAQQFEFIARLEFGDIDLRDKGSFQSADEVEILDDAVTNATMFIGEDHTVTELEVGLRIDHPRVSDLVVHLISPTGKRNLLVENRGGLDPDGYGGGGVITNAFRTDSGGPEANTNTIPVGANSGTLIVNYDFFSIPDQMRVYYDGALIKDTTLISGSGFFSLDFGPGASTDLVITMNEGNNTDTNTAWTYNATVIADTLSYLVLTEDKQKTTTPIKFAVPPFASATNLLVVFSNSFEGGTPGTYVASDTFDGWTVATNDVTLLADAATAHTGLQYLQLSTGAVTRVLPTQAGKSYELSFFHRLDIIPVVNGSFEEPPGITRYQTFGVGTGIPGWTIASGNVDIVGPYWDAADGVQSLDLNGTGQNMGNIYQNVSTVPGKNYRIRLAHAGNPECAMPVLKSADVSWDGSPVGSLLFDVTGRSFNDMGWTYWETDVTASQPTTQLRFQSTSTSFCGPTLDDVSVSPIGRLEVAVDSGDFTVVDVGTQWQESKLRFTAPGDGTTVTITGLETGGLVDTIVLREVSGDVFYLPEEPMEVACENTFGTWTLELWDNRAGAPVGPTALRSWELQFTYDTITQLPTRIQPGVGITNTIPPGGIFQLRVDVPFWASIATNTLIFATNDPVNVYVNPTNLITGTNAGDILKLNNSVGGSFNLDAFSLPPLIPGGEYFVGIENPGTNTVTFAFRVDFDITALMNGVPITAILTTNRYGGFERYFSFDVSTNASAVSFDLFDLDGDVDLVARRGALPTFTYDYGSFNFGTNDENITVLPDSVPVPLSPGRWYLGVWLAQSSDVTYTIQATELTNDFSNVITLTNGVPYTNVNSGSGSIEDYYRFNIVAPVTRAQFDVFNPTADVSLVASKGLPLPSFASFDYISANPGTNDEFILVLPDSVPVAVSPGEWFLTVINTSGESAAYTIKAEQWAEAIEPIVIRDPTLGSNTFCFSWNSIVGGRYVVRAKVALTDTNWVNYSGTITATDTTTSYCVALPSIYHFFQVIEGVAVGGPGVPQISIQAIRVGPGTVTLEWLAPPTYRFDVQYSDVFPPVWNTIPGGPVTSANGNFAFTDDGTLTGGPPLPGIRYYRLILVP